MDRKYKPKVVPLMDEVRHVRGFLITENYKNSLQLHSELGATAPTG